MLYHHCKPYCTGQFYRLPSFLQVIIEDDTSCDSAPETPLKTITKVTTMTTVAEESSQESQTEDDGETMGETMLDVLPPIEHDLVTAVMTSNTPAKHGGLIETFCGMGGVGVLQVGLYA